MATLDSKMLGSNAPNLKRHTYMCVCVRVWIYTYTHTHIYIHIHIYTLDGDAGTDDARVKRANFEAAYIYVCVCAFG